VVSAPRCDFCSSPEPLWLYAAKTFAAPGTGFSGVSVGAWAACELCAELIEADDRDGLASRSLAQIAGRNPILRDPSLRRDAERQVVALQAAFFEHRDGSRRRI